MRNSNLDFLRAMAIVLVVICHLGMEGYFSHSVSQVFLFGGVGVDLFFGLSGFLVGSIYFKGLARNQGKLEFWKARWARTLPPYLAALLVYSAGQPGYFHTAPWQKLGQFIFVQNFFYDPPGFYQSWSLCIEEHFYLLLPFVGPFLYQIFQRRYLAVFLLPLVFRVVQSSLGITTGQMGQYFETHLRFEGLLLGTFLAFQKNTGALPKIRWAGALGAALLLGSHLSVFPGWLQPLWSALGAYFLVLAGITASGPWPLAASKAIHWIATRSYTIYLIHMGVFHIPRILSAHGMPAPLEMPIYLASLLPLSELFYRVVEAPALKLKEKVKAAASPEPAASLSLG